MPSEAGWEPMKWSRSPFRRGSASIWKAPPFNVSPAGSCTDWCQSVTKHPGTNDTWGMMGWQDGGYVSLPLLSRSRFSQKWCLQSCLSSGVHVHIKNPYGKDKPVPRRINVQKHGQIKHSLKTESSPLSATSPGFHVQLTAFLSCLFGGTPGVRSSLIFVHSWLGKLCQRGH